MDETLEQRLSEAVEKMGMPKADVLRIAIDQGLRDLATIGYDLGSAIHERVMQARQFIE